MIEYYLEIRQVHIFVVLASGGFLALRSLAFFAGGRWALSAPFRWLDYTLHTIILTAAMMLMVVTEQYPFAQGWLTVKLTLYFIYTALSFMALQPGSVPRKRRALLALAALVILGYIYTVARAHHPLGLLASLAS